ncbi:MAG: Slp family lipoprotein [Granulosicoccus sp.]|nr:Slp family lipoprotein [Granulosicoccus sp.]
MLLNRLLWITPLLLWLSACASNPVDSSDVSVRSTPDAIVKADAPTTGKVLWGGVILSSANLSEGTQIEVLSYPLDHRQLPMTQRNSTGRFVVEHPEYLETYDYAPGRLISVVGTLSGIDKGSIGKAEYHYVQIVPDSLYLWREDGSDRSPSFSVGVGINISN